MSKFIETDKLLAEIKELLKTAENEEKEAFAKLDAEGHLVAVTKTAICTKIVGIVTSLQQELPEDNYISRLRLQTDSFLAGLTAKKGGEK